MILEAIALKVKKEDADAQEAATKTSEKKQWKKDFSGLEQYR